MASYLALDAGGTKTKYVLADETHRSRVDTGVADTQFGQIASQGSPVRSQERHLQFSANYRF